jgi:hypothetical protein
MSPRLSRVDCHQDEKAGRGGASQMPDNGLHILPLRLNPDASEDVVRSIPSLTNGRD